MIARKMLRSAYLNTQGTQQLKSQLDHEQFMEKDKNAAITKHKVNIEPETDTDYEVKYLRHTLNKVKKQVAQVDNRLAQRLDFQIDLKKMSPYENYGPINVNSIKYYRETDTPVQQLRVQYNKLIQENQIALAQSKAQRLDLEEKQEQLQSLIRQNDRLRQYMKVLSDGNAQLADFETMQDLTNMRAEYDILLEVKEEKQKLIEKLTEQLNYLENVFNNNIATI